MCKKQIHGYVFRIHETDQKNVFVFENSKNTSARLSTDSRPE